MEDQDFDALKEGLDLIESRTDALSLSPAGQRAIYGCIGAARGAIAAENWDLAKDLTLRSLVLYGKTNRADRMADGGYL